MTAPTLLTVSLDAIAANYVAIRRHVGTAARIIAVVKADAYGHGAREVAGRLLREGVDAFAVASVDEAVFLREGGIRAPILVLGGGDALEAREAVRRGVTMAAYDASVLAEMNDEAKKRESVAHIHLKIDTGMARVGTRGAEKLETLLDAVRDLPFVKLEGLFTHFADADGDAEYTREQHARFTRAAEAVRARGYRPMLHEAASSAISRSIFLDDAVRPGIALYGAQETTLLDIRPAQRLITRPLRLEWIEAGETAGYGRTFTAVRRTRLMTLPVGYADGYPRSLSNHGAALVAGKRAPIAGRVCMNLMMLDVTGIPGVTTEDEVALLGNQGSDAITPDELAAWAGTIPYELMITLGRLAQRRIIA